MDFGVIRRITTTCDLEKIIELERKCFNNEVAYTAKQLRYLTTKANSTCLLETTQDALRGFIIVLYKNGTQVAGIEILNVDPMHRGNGIGKKLLKAAEEEMYPRGINKIRLEVSVGNTPAINLYERSGFRRSAILKNYYRYEHHRSLDAFRMVKEIVT